MFALTSIKGIGRRFANLVCKKADVDMNKRYRFFLLLLFYNIYFLPVDVYEYYFSFERLGILFILFYFINLGYLVVGLCIKGVFSVKFSMEKSL